MLALLPAIDIAHASATQPPGGRASGEAHEAEDGDRDPVGARKVTRRYDRVLFSSVELAEISIFAGSGMKHSLSGDIEAPGPIALFMTNLGATRQRWEGPDGFVAHVPRLTQITRVYFGRQANTRIGFLTLVAGPEMIRAQTLGEDALPRWQATRLGAAFLGELWREAPMPGRAGSSGRSYLLHATLMAGSALPSVWGRLAGGIEIADGVFAGPELTGYAEPGYREWRVGAHVTGWRVGPARLRFAGGISMPEGGRNDVYLGLQAHMLR